MKFSEMPYKRPELEELKKQMEVLIGELIIIVHCPAAAWPVVYGWFRGRR